MSSFWSLVSQLQLYRKTLCPVPLNDQYPSNFDRGLDKGYIRFRDFNIFINFLLS